MELLLANPPKRKRRRRRKLYGAAAMAAAKARRRVRKVTRRASRRRRRRASTSGGGGTTTMARRTYRRSRRRSGVFSSRRGFALKETAHATAGVVAGFFATNVATDQVVRRIPVEQLQSGYGRIAAKAGIAVAIGMLMGAVKPTRRYAVPIAAGGLASAAFDAIVTVRARAAGGGTAGYMAGYEHTRPQLGAGGSGYIGVDAHEAVYVD